MSKNVTLKDIAKALDLSISTISKALNDSYEISSDTKNIVLAYAKSQRYSPNRMAKGLKEGKSRSIGVVVCSLDNNFVSQMLDGIDKYSTEKAYQIIIMQSKESHEQEIACLSLLYAGGVDGILISPAYQGVDLSYLNSLQESGLPVVLFDRLSDQIETHKVGADNFKGAYEATTHLIEAGYKKIAHLNTNTTLSITTERLNGYKKALLDNGIEFRSELVKFCDYADTTTLTNDLEDSITYFMKLEERPDAIFTATDQITTRCLAILNRFNYKIPEQVAIIGFTNTDLAEALNPSLSTVHQPAFEIGVQAAQKLISLIESRYKVTEFETIVLDTVLMVRDSTRNRLRG